MRRPTTKLLLLILVVTVAATSAGRATSTTVCVPRERDALLAFKGGITSDPAGRLALWRRGGDCCRWTGVRCSNRTGHVLQLRLGNNFAGHVVRQRYNFDRLDFELALGKRWYSVSGDGDESTDAAYAAMGGHISPALFSLEHLEHLDLSWNWQLDFRTPRLLGSLKSLRYLNLCGIGFGDGLFPPQLLGNLSKLQYLDLSYTPFSIQEKDLSSLARLTFLQHLDLSGVNLTMVHDWPHIVNMVPSLRVLYLSDCFLQNANQRLPHLNLTRLESLDLSSNLFDEPFKSCWFWNLTNLKYLNLGYNFFYGQFPDTLGKMASLQVFDSSYNHGGFIAPGLMRNLCNLEVLNLNKGLAYGNMTEIYESLPHCSLSKLRLLDLSRSNIAGTLRTGIVKFTSLVILRLSYNNLTGTVPFEIGMLNNLTSLYLGHNKLTGVITEEHFSGLTSLRAIDLSYNLLKIVVDPSRLPTWRISTT